MPFGWGAPDSTYTFEKAFSQGWGHQCLSAGGLLTPEPPKRYTIEQEDVTNAFRLGGS